MRIALKATIFGCRIAILFGLLSLSLLVGTASQAEAQGFVWPVENARINQPFACRGCLGFSGAGLRYQNGINVHTGVDLKPDGYTFEEDGYTVSVYAAADGDVVKVIPYTGTVTTTNHGLGNAVIVRHTVGTEEIYTLYGHLDSVSVAVGDSAKQRGHADALPLGKMGHSGQSAAGTGGPALR